MGERGDSEMARGRKHADRGAHSGGWHCCNITLPVLTCSVKHAMKRDQRPDHNGLLLLE